MAMIPPIQSLKANYPLRSKKALAEEMGFEGTALEEILKLWANTCAIRMSYCLLKCGIELGVEPGRGEETMIRSGTLKGQYFWMSRAKLSERLRNFVFGKPTFADKASTAEGYDQLLGAIGKTGGVISYEALGEDWISSTYGGGHIDVVYYDGNFFTGTLGEQYDLMIEEVNWWGTRGFYAQCRRAVTLQFWKSSG
ncbi:T6SS effector amidase Tae4 family protein [Sorangium sp. So ce1153]|uniref:T6SS effector amidase Tae4 family protein n=1 Tax=Sorangium sp. So ce1153 TaxID=3133333 RepID=UPI003F5F8C8A